mmetsp:Transcript_23904/g.52726  ORF Transcript_23904/g.52726 Transcript_23904/m.52726 type:complete len:93 (+) Transcript_23904:60-338(+)
MSRLQPLQGGFLERMEQDIHEKRVTQALVERYGAKAAPSTRRHATDRPGEPASAKLMVNPTIATHHAHKNFEGEGKKGALLVTNLPGVAQKN